MRKYNEENNKIKEEQTIQNILEEKDKRKSSFEEEGKKMFIKLKSVQFAYTDEEVDKEAPLSPGKIEK